jgi:ribonucleotide monophosphatase NagD (HAD superfamily)
MKRARRAPARGFPKLAGLMFDVDGTLLLSDRSLGGYELLPHAAETLDALASRGVPYVLLTNGSAYPPAEQAAKLRKLGLAVRDEQMITPSSVAAQLMAGKGIDKVLVLGSEGVGHALREAGIETRTAAHAAPTRWMRCTWAGTRIAACGTSRPRATRSSPARSFTWLPTCRSSPRAPVAPSATATPSSARSGA